MGTTFNSCLLNEYRNGSQYIGFHADDEKDLGENRMVATVSLGGARDFVLKPKKSEGEKTTKILLESGSLVVMAGECQRLYHHSIPKRASAEYRVSLTFRRLNT
eukprot:Opistho-2@2763